MPIRPSLVLFLALFVFLPTSQRAQASYYAPLAGGDYILPPGGVREQSIFLSGRAFSNPVSDSTGNIYLGLLDRNVIIRRTPTGIVTQFAGTGLNYDSGDGGPARLASIATPRTLAIDSRDNLYVLTAAELRVINRMGIITKISLNPALSIRYLAIDPSDTIYAANQKEVYRKRVSDGAFVLFAGESRNPIVSLPIQSIRGIACDGAGRLLLADSPGSIRRIATTGEVSSFITNVSYQWESSPFAPHSLVVDRRDVLYFITNSELWRVEGTTGRRVAYVPRTIFPGLYPEIEATRIGIGPNSSLLEATTDLGYLSMYELAGAGSYNRTPLMTSLSPSVGGVAVRARETMLNQPTQAISSVDGSTYFADTRFRTIFRVAPDGTMRRVAGNGSNIPYHTPGSQAADAALDRNVAGSILDPRIMLAVTPTKEIYFASGDCTIRRVSADGIMTDFAGKAETYPRYLSCGSTVTGAVGPGALLGERLKLRWSVNGNLIVQSRDQLLRFSINAAATVVASGILFALAIAEDSSGNIYVAEGGPRPGIFRVDSAGVRTNIIGYRPWAKTPDGSIAGSSSIEPASAIAIGPDSLLYFVEADAPQVRRIRKDGKIETVFSANAATDTNSANLRSITSIDFTPGGQLLVTDSVSGKVGLISLDPVQSRIPKEALNFDILPGQTGSARVLPLASSVPGVAFNASIEYSGASGGAVTVSPSAGYLPAELTLTVSAQNMASGSHDASLVVTTPSSTPAISRIPIRINIPDTRPPKLEVPREALQLRSILAEDSPIERLEVRNRGGGRVEYLIDEEIPPWLRVEPSRGVLTAGQSAWLELKAVSKGLSQGIYSGVLGLRQVGGERSRVPVSLVVAADNTQLVLSQSALSLRAGAGSPMVTTGEVKLIATGKGSISWDASVEATTGGNWLRILNPKGTVAAFQSAFPSLQVEINASSLRTGTYYGAIRIEPLGAPSLRQVLTVILDVVPATAIEPLEIEPGALVFTGPQGQLPSAQQITIRAITPTRFFSSSATVSGQPWLASYPSSAPVAPASPVSVFVQPNYASLPIGAHRGALTIQLEDGTLRTVNVLAIVQPRSTSPAISTCTQPSINILPLSARSRIATRIGRAESIRIQAYDSCGQPLDPVQFSNASVTATFSSREQPLALHFTGNGVWESSWTPVLAAESGELTIAAVARGAVAMSGEYRIPFTVAPSTQPALIRGGVMDSAGFQPHLPLAPGSLFTAFGVNLATSTTIAASLPLPNKLDEVSLRIDNKPVPLVFVSANQINGQLPFDLDPGREYQVEMTRGEQRTTPVPILVAAARPGVFTVNQSGAGPALVFKADGSPVTSANPARSGEIVVVYAAGLGRTVPNALAGAPAPNALNPTENPVTVTVGGKPAVVHYAGLVASFTGLYQINLQLPEDSEPSDSAVLSVAVAGQVSNTSFIAIRD